MNPPTSRVFTYGMIPARRRCRFRPSRFRRLATVLCGLCLSLIGLSYIAPTALAVTIAEARAAGGGVALTIDNAIVTSTTDLVSSARFKCIYAQDATGGIYLFGPTADIDILLSSIAEGDRINISGTSSSFNGRFQLTGPFTVQNKEAVGVPDPVPITLADMQDFSATAEGFENKLVRLNGIVFVDAGGTFVGVTNELVSDTSLTGTTRISTLALDMVGTSIPNGPVDIVGILGQQDVSNPGPGVPGKGYQIHLRSLADIIPTPEPISSPLLIEVVADSALVKVGDDVIATVKHGERFELLRRDGPWLAISVQTSEGDREGWIFVKRIQDIIEPGLDQESTAPAAFESIRADVRLTQFSQGTPTKLFFELTLANQGTKAVHYDASDLILMVDEEAIRIVQPGRQQSSWVYKEGSMNGRVHSSQLNTLGAGKIAPGSTVSGWVSFEVPEIKKASDSRSKHWVLSGNFSGREMQLNLRQHELVMIGAKIRSSTIDPSIQVLEIGPCVNGFNVARLFEARQALEAKRKPYIVMLTSGDCVVGDLGFRRLSSVRSQYRVQPIFVNFPRELRQRLRFHYGHYEAETESAAVVQIVGQGPLSGGQLIKYLADASSVTRAAAAKALARHYGESGVVEALLLAVTDEDPGVRSAVVRSLTGPLSRRRQRSEQSPSQTDAQVLEAILNATDDDDATVRSAASGVLAGSDDPQATEAVLKTMADKIALVRTTAARAAGSHPATSVAEPLLKLLDDPDWKVTVAAATSLGKLKSEPAVPRLQELESGESKPVAAAAIDALRAIGVHSDLEAAIRKIDVAGLSRDEFKVLAQSKEKRVVEKLIAAMQSRQVRQNLGSLARTLGQIGDTDAVEPLINQMVYNNVRNDDLAWALGKLGDKRAIEPLEQSLAKAPGSSSYQRALHEALLMLDAPGVLDQLMADLKEQQNQYEAQKILEVLGRAGGDQVVVVVAPYLDDARLCQFAAGALWDINSDAALAEIKKRLHDKEYPHAQMVASRLLRMPSRSSQSQTEAEAQKTERVVALFKDLRDSPHSAVQNYIRSHLASLERRIVDEELREFQSLVTAKNLNSAAEVFEAAVRRCLDAVGDSSSQASRLTVYVSTMQRALSRIGESERAEQLLAATLSIIEAEAEKTGQEELHDIIVDLRGQRLMTMISRGLDVESDEVTQLLSDIKSQLSRKAESGLTSADLSLATRMGRILEHRDKPELAANIYRTIIEVIREMDDERLARIAEMLEGSIRRMALVGNLIELSGTTVNGDVFDWESYRGKVVLIDFWATWCGPCRAEVPNVMKNYQLYHDRGFDVVGISLDRDRKALMEYLDSDKLPWVTLHEQEAKGNHPVAVHYGISAIPTVILVDRDGKVVSLRARGQKLGQLLQQLIGPALGATEQEVLNATEAFLAFLDKGTFGGAYDSLSVIGKRPVTRGQFSNSIQKLQDAFGNATHRTLHKVQLINKFPGLPEGRYAGVQFKSDFERQKGAWESVLLNLETNGQWRVNTYAIRLEPLPFPESKTRPNPRKTSGILTRPPTIPPGGLPIGRNLIIDSSLENTHLGRLPRSWSAWLDHGPDFKCQVVEGGVTDKHCLQISGKGTRGVVFCTSVPMDRTKRYALKGRVKLEGDATSWAVIKINYFNKSGWLGVNDRVGVSAKESGWQFFEKTDHADDFPEATLMVPTCHIEGNGTAWFDDLELVAYDRVTLPEDFEAKHGRNNRLTGSLDLDRWVGRWETTIENKPTGRTPAKTIQGKAVVRKILDDQFLLWQISSEAGEPQYMAVLGFDEYIGAYHLWLFSSEGNVYERVGQWDEAAQLLALDVKPPSPGITGFSTDRFVDNDHIETTLLVKNADGQVTRDVRMNWVRKSSTVPVDIDVSSGPVSSSPELALLLRMAGDWTIHQTNNPSVWFPKGENTTFTEKAEWAIGGRFLLLRSYDDKKQMKSLGLMTYEPKEKSYHYWHFANDVFGGQWRITWDDSSRGFHWRSIDMPTGWIGTGFNRWIDGDTSDNQALIKDEQGRVLLDLRQEKKRKKDTSR